MFPINLSFEDRLKLLVPASLYYAHKIAKEAKRTEPELLIVRDIVPPGCTAIDVGANRGYYSYALAEVAGRVEAFEPNPAVARFARSKLGARARVHEVALSNREGSAILHIPTVDGVALHLMGNLGNVYSAPDVGTLAVRLATLDSFGFDGVGFVKIDVEGAELDVIEGAARTIARDRPVLLVELLTEAYADPLSNITRLEESLGYAASIVVGNRRLGAREALGRREVVKTRNVLFMPR